MTGAAGSAYGNIAAVASLVAKRQQEFSRLMETPLPENPYGIKSDMWVSLLEDRQNFPDVNDLLLFRSGFRDSISGLGLNKRLNDEERKTHRQAILHLVETFQVPEDIIRDLDEPMLGAPEVVEMFGNQVSPLFVRHACEVYQIKRFFEQYGPPTSPIRVCEIGGGFGGTAHLVLKNFDVAEFTLIDLPENLYLASLFLPLTLQGRTHAVFDPAKGAFESQRQELNFVLADFTDHVTSKFDLILNAASLGEMPRPTVSAYMDWIERALTPEGIFYSFNRANVQGIDGAKTLSDFHLDQFHLHEFLPMKQLSLPFNDVGFEAVATRAENGRPVLKDMLDPVGMLLACGFRQPVVDLMDDLKSTDLGEAQKDAFMRLETFFYEEDLDRKAEILARSDFTDSRLGAMVAVLQAMVAFVGENFETFMARSDAIAWGQLGPIAESRIRIARALVSYRANNENWTQEIEEIRRIVEPFAEFSRNLVENDSMGRLRNVLWHSITPYSTPQAPNIVAPLPGVPTRIKNRIKRMIGTAA